MIYRLVLILFMALSAPALAAQGPEPGRIALIIGNDDYAAGGTLRNARNDAALVAAAARRTGFSVTVASDLNLATFNATLRQFRDRAAGAEVAMIYYAGHGMESSGKNWLIPIDATLSSQLDLPYDAIDLDRVLEAVSGAKIRMVVLDACRDNPFGRRWRSGTRGVARGLAEVEVDDVLVIYSAAPGSVAADGPGSNSPFAISFATRLSQPNLPLQLLGGLVRDDVLKSTGKAQRPYVSASITGTPIYLVSRPVAQPSQQQPAPSKPVDSVPSYRRSRLASELNSLLSAQKSGAAEVAQGDIYYFLTRPTGSESTSSVAANTNYFVMFVKNPGRGVTRICEARRGYYAVGFALSPSLAKDSETFRWLSAADRPVIERLCRGLRLPLSSLFEASEARGETAGGRGKVWDWLARNSGTVNIVLTPAKAFGRAFEDRMFRRYWAVGLAKRYAEANASQVASDPAAFAQLKAIQSGGTGTFGALRDNSHYIIGDGIAAYPPRTRREFGDEVAWLDSAWAEFLASTTVRIGGTYRNPQQGPLARAFSPAEIGSAQFWRSAHDVRNVVEQANCLAEQFLNDQIYRAASSYQATSC